MGKQAVGARPVRLGPSGGRRWPAEEYAHLPPAERDFILANLALAGLLIRAPKPPPGPAGISQQGANN